MFNFGSKEGAGDGLGPSPEKVEADVVDEVGEEFPLSPAATRTLQEEGD